MNVKKTFLFITVIFLTLAACLFLWFEQAAEKPESRELPQRSRVRVVTLNNQPITLTRELPGRATAFRNAEVRPQVGGIVQKRLFTEGQEVKAQQPLYQIDPVLYQTEYNRSDAALARANAQLRVATLLIQRYRPLVDTRVISQQTYDDAVAAQQQANADVLVAKANLETASINLVYTRVLSPIDGVIGRSAVTEGALVTAQQASAIASVQQIDPIYVDITQPTAQLLRLKDAFNRGALTAGDASQSAIVTLMLEDGSRYAHPGKLQFSDISVDHSTGSVILRAIFPNPDRQLLPGMFVRAHLMDGMAASNGLLVPQRGVTRNTQGKATALVVESTGKVELREVVTERALGDQWLISTGLSAGDRVIVEGGQTVRPGMQVIAAEWPSAARTDDGKSTVQIKEPANG